jgi:hypothetical protein
LESFPKHQNECKEESKEHKANLISNAIVEVTKDDAVVDKILIEHPRKYAMNNPVVRRLAPAPGATHTPTTDAEGQFHAEAKISDARYD